MKALLFNVFSSLLSRIKKPIASIVVLGLAYTQAAYALTWDVSGVDASTMLINFAASVPALMTLVTSFAYVLGFYFVIKGVLDMKHFGESRSMMSQEHTITKPITFIAVGAMLLYLPGAIHAGMATFWTDPNPYGYVSTGNDSWSQITNAAFLIIQLVGVIAFIRGLIMFTRLTGHGGGQDSFGKALAHLIAGIFCINLYQFLQAIFTTLGLGTLS